MPLALNFWIYFSDQEWNTVSVAGFGGRLCSGIWVLLCFLLPLSVPCSLVFGRAWCLAGTPRGSCSLKALLISALQGLEPWPGEYQKQDVGGLVFLVPHLSGWLDVLRASYRHIKCMFLSSTKAMIVQVQIMLLSWVFSSSTFCSFWPTAFCFIGEEDGLMVLWMLLKVTKPL